jgi:hypothetical protein
MVSGSMVVRYHIRARSGKEVRAWWNCITLPKSWISALHSLHQASSTEQIIVGQ